MNVTKSGWRKATPEETLMLLEIEPNGLRESVFFHEWIKLNISSSNYVYATHYFENLSVATPGGLSYVIVDNKEAYWLSREHLGLINAWGRVMYNTVDYHRFVNVE